ncbi:MAG TPA: nucleotidyltransferase family protein [Pyrinomonadaceae bacterium]|nr:nucleotidyltransferase family protein [Pyrinomonadaceae bacterium]
MKRKSSFFIPHPCSHVAAILLAAGRSRRMGAFKPLLPFPEDRTVIEACIANLLDGGVDTLVVVLGHRADEVRARVSYLPVSFAFNLDAESEMSVSVARGVEQLPTEVETILIALSDQPAIPPEIIGFLIAERRRSGARLVVPEYSGRGGHPVLIDPGLRPELLQLDAERGLRALFLAHRDEVLRVPVASPYIARDMDTWDDYRALYGEVFGFAPPNSPGS